MLTNNKGTSLTAWWLANGAVRIIDNSDVVEFQDESGNALVTRVAGIPTSGQNLKDVPNWLDAKSIGAIIQFSFDGASPPSAGANTAKFGFCHTTGGSYTAGEVVYDTGAALTKLPNIWLLITTNAVTGTISLNANGLYAKVSGTWTLSGDGSSSSTYTPIKVAFAHDNATPASTTSIPDTAEVYLLKVVITEVFNGTSPTIAVATDGSTPVTLVATTDFDIKQAEQYENANQQLLGADKGGHVAITVTPDSSTTGAGYVEVWYAIPAA